MNGPNQQENPKFLNPDAIGIENTRGMGVPDYFQKNILPILLAKKEANKPKEEKGAMDILNGMID